MRAFIIGLAVLIAACTATATGDATGEGGSGHPLDGILWDVRAAAPITPQTLAERLAGADIAILGEIHDNPRHHMRQAWLVERIAPAGIAFEMIPEASEEGIAVFRAGGGTARAVGPAIGWDRLGWPDWSHYAPILEAAEDAYIAGGGVSRVRIRKAMEAGAASAFGTGAAAYGLAAGLDPRAETAAVAEMIAAHCGHLPASAARPMIEAQRLRDARFAHAARRARAVGGGNAVLITGNGHARTDWGVPQALASSEPELSVLSLGQVEVRSDVTSAEAYPPGTLPYDYVWFSEPAERGDPCAAFR